MITNAPNSEAGRLFLNHIRRDFLEEKSFTYCAFKNQLFLGMKVMVVPLVEDDALIQIRIDQNLQDPDLVQGLVQVHVQDQDPDQNHAQGLDHVQAQDPNRALVPGLAHAPDQVLVLDLHQGADRILELDRDLVDQDPDQDRDQNQDQELALNPDLGRFYFILNYSKLKIDQ